MLIFNIKEMSLQHPDNDPGLKVIEIKPKVPQSYSFPLYNYQ